MKTCSVCNVEQEDSAFSRTTKTPDGLNVFCKACRKTYYYRSKCAERQHTVKPHKEPYLKDKTGHRYGQLVVQSFDHRDEKGEPYWLCLCDCGNHKVALGRNLRSGCTTNCGCYLSEYQRTRQRSKVVDRLDREGHILHLAYSALKNRNKKLCSDEPLSFEEYKRLAKSPCVYCGAEYSKSKPDTHSKEKGQAYRLSDHICHCNGIDRVDSSKGYITENCVTCCTTCNYGKQQMSKDEFFAWIKRVHDHSNLGEPTC